VHAGDEDDRRCRSTKLEQGSRSVQVRVHSRLVLVLALDSKQVLEPELDSKLVLVRVRSKLVLALDSSLVLAHSNHCHDDGDDDQLRQQVQTTLPRPIRPELEEQTSWRLLLKKGTTCWASVQI
jgi:hypothetical protein